jgi:hypothetical protein
MPVISATPIKYDLPYPGQLFQREEQDGKWEYGIINGLKSAYTEHEGTKTLASWTASLTTGFRDYRGLISNTAIYHNTTDWHPAPAPEAPVLGDVVDKAAFLLALERIAMLEEARLAEEEASEALKARMDALSAPLVNGTPPERPRRGVPA